MINSPYLKAVFVLLLTFMLTALSVLTVYGVVVLILPKEFVETGILFEGFFAIIFIGACLRYFANELIYSKDDQAKLQVLGGVRIGDLWQAKWSGRSASWPFAKLSASQETIRLQTIFGNYDWERADLRLIVRKAGLWQWKIGAEDSKVAGAVFFFVLPWQAKGLERRLKELGYGV